MADFNQQAMEAAVAVLDLSGFTNSRPFGLGKSLVLSKYLVMALTGQRRASSG